MELSIIQRNEVTSSMAKDGWQLDRESCALPFPLIEGYQDQSATFVARKRGQQIVIVVKQVAPPSAYPRIIRAIIEQHARFKPSAGEIETEVIIDESLGHFELAHSGWVNGRRVHGAVIHVDLRGDKIWIQLDGTEFGVANELLATGVPKEDIVLAFHSPEMRKYTDFAVA